MRALGFHPWMIVAPQAIEGALTVLVLYRAVSRLAAAPAGLVAVFVAVASPAAVALNRGNIPDSLMTLLLVLAGPSRDPRLQWIAAQCHQLPFSAGPLNNYYCTPQDAG